MQNLETQRGLQRAGFVSLAFAAPKLAPVAGQDAMQLSWSSTPGRSYQVEYSPDLDRWFIAPYGEQIATGNSASWIDTGSPRTPALPSQSPVRFYRVMQFGVP